MNNKELFFRGHPLQEHCFSFSTAVVVQKMHMIEPNPLICILCIVLEFPNENKKRRKKCRKQRTNQMPESAHNKDIRNKKQEYRVRAHGKYIAKQGKGRNRNEQSHLSRMERLKFQTNSKSF